MINKLNSTLFPLRKSCSSTFGKFFREANIVRITHRSFYCKSRFDIHDCAYKSNSCICRDILNEYNKICHFHDMPNYELKDKKCYFMKDNVYDNELCQIFKIIHKNEIITNFLNNKHPEIISKYKSIIEKQSNDDQEVMLVGAVITIFIYISIGFAIISIIIYCIFG
jgi:hypothetical protein